MAARQNNVDLRSAASQPAPVKPGLIVTVYDGNAKSTFDALERSQWFLERARPDIVCLHTRPDNSDAKCIALAKQWLPGVRIWISPPSNCLVDVSPSEACKMAASWARATRHLGAEVLLFNGESRRGGNSGWAARDTERRTALASRATDLLKAAQEASQGVALGWTSHDHPKWHHLPWRAIMGQESPIRLNAPQQYAYLEDSSTTIEGRKSLASLAAARKRQQSSNAQWTDLARRGEVNPLLCPVGNGFVPYLAGYGVSVAGTCAMAENYNLVQFWSSPDRLDIHGRRAVEALRKMREAVGVGPDLVKRYQQFAEIGVDGEVGPETLGALGVE